MAAEFAVVVRDSLEVSRKSFPGESLPSSDTFFRGNWVKINMECRANERVFSLFLLGVLSSSLELLYRVVSFFFGVCYYDYERLVPAIFSLQCFRLWDTKKYVCAKEKFQFSFSCRTLFRRAALLHKSIFFFYFMKIDINQPHSFRFTTTSPYENSIYNLRKSCYKKLTKKQEVKNIFL